MGESDGLVRLWTGSGPRAMGSWDGSVVFLLAMAVIVTSIRACYVCWTQKLQDGSEICNAEALRIPWGLV